MMDNFSDLTHRAEVVLPSFGSLCSRAARRLRLNPLTLASDKQRAWIQAANAALGALEKSGALTKGYSFIAYDERLSLAALNLLASSSAERYGKPKGVSVAHSLSTKPSSESPPTSIRSIGASLESRSARPYFEPMARAFGDPHRARVFTVAHEFGHSWHTAYNFPWTRAAATASPSGEDLNRLSDLYGKPNGPDRFSKEPLQLLRGLFEECAADAIACWALERALPGRGAVDQAIVFRELQEPGRVHVLALPHQTSWFLRELRSDGALGEPSFDAFAERVTQLFKRLGPKTCSIFLQEPAGSTAERPPSP